VPGPGLASSASLLPPNHLAKTLDSALTARLREILASGTVTETDLRELSEQADGWARTLRAQIRASEQKLRALNRDPGSPISDIADELRRVETLRPQLREVRALLAELETRARSLRTAWLRRQTGLPESVEDEQTQRS
jgi:chromosome segregation ATPase